MKRMDVLTVAGIFLGLALVFGAIAAKGEGGIGVFWDFSSLLITVGGSFSALLIRFQLDQVKMVFQITKNAFFTEVDSIADVIRLFVRLGHKARREGLLALEDDIEQIEDPFTRTGLQMVVDGLDQEIIKDIMYIQLESLESRHRLGQEMFKFWGALAPAFGMIGTLIGLVFMLVNLDDVEAIGPGMAVALLTTFYGALLANLIFIPIAGKLEMRSQAEVAVKEAIIEGVLSIQAGTNPRMLQEKLKAFVSPKEQEALESYRVLTSTQSTEEVLLDER